MRIPIPDDIKKLIEDYKVHGDFAAISKRLTKSENNTNGDTTRSSEVSNAVETGSGVLEVVREITKFYKEKAQAIQEINAL